MGHFGDIAARSRHVCFTAERRHPAGLRLAFPQKTLSETPTSRSAHRTRCIDRARADFEDAWRIFLSNRTEADLQEWRDQRDWTARK
jgi:hypothetical protein